jgi:hypothetical protein
MNARGEIELALGEKKYTLALEYAAIKKIEREAGGLISLARALPSGDVTLDQVVSIIRHASGTSDSEETVGNAVLSAGMLAALNPISDFVTLAIAGGMPVDGEGKKKPTK